MRWNDLVVDRKKKRPPLFASLASLASLIRQRGIGVLLTKAFQLWQREGKAGIYHRLAMLGHGYRQWAKSYDTLNDVDRRMILDHIGRFSRRPRISVLMPTYNPSERWLRHAIGSVQAQLYPHWELCIADDASTMPGVHEVLDEFAARDPRIRVTYRSRNGHISAASNSALETANGEFVALLDQDDVLAEHALYLVALAVNENPGLGLVYSDEDKIDHRGERHEPYFKPDWNPELMRCQNVVSHLGVYRAEIVRAVGGFREELEGSQDWDLALRVAEQLGAHGIHHIPHVLYHWRMHSESTASNIHAKQYAITAGKRAVTEHLARCGLRAEVLAHPKLAGRWRVRYALPEKPPLVSIIIPTRNGFELLKRCINTLRGLTDYPSYELIVMDNQSDDPATLDLLNRESENNGIRVYRYDAPFNYSAINNAAALQARGEVFCFLNNDTEVTDAGWLSELVSHAARPGIGAVGARLFYPNGRIQHAGVVLGVGGVASHIYAGSLASECGSMGRAVLQQNLSAVTGACMVVTRTAFERVRGFEAEHLPVAFNDVDFCLKLLEAGYQNVWTPYATLIHHESVSRGMDDTPEKQRRFSSEIAYMQHRWGTLLANDPAYNPNLTLAYAYPLPSSPPRREKPWRK